MDAGRLRWPESGHGADGSGFGCNRDYCDLRGMTMSDAADVMDEEGELVSRIEAAEDVDEELDLIEEELAEDPGGMMGLDVGVAAAVAALSAIGCMPFASCNGGAFGGRHHEAYPLVAFCARPGHVPALMDAAVRAGVGLESDAAGDVVVYADDVRRMRGFAASLLARLQDDAAGAGAPDAIV